MLLRQGRVTAWETEVASGTPPVEILLDGVAAVPQAEDPELLVAAQETVAARNEATAMVIDPMLARMASVDYYAPSVATGAPEPTQLP